MIRCVPQVQLVKYDDEEYDSLVRPYDTGPNSGGWTREETDYLYDMCEQLDLRWHVIWDRYEVRYGIAAHNRTARQRHGVTVLGLDGPAHGRLRNH